MRRVALAGVVANAGIIMTGAAVRLSASGLGCPDWPDCTSSSLVAAHTRGDPMFHTYIEFTNRMLTFAVMVVAVLVMVTAWRFRPAGARRRGLVWLAAAQPLGVVAQAVLGGIVVLTDLNPAAVSLHFLLSSAILALAVTLWSRCAEGDRPATRLVRADLRVLSVALVPVVALMLAAGTVVTGTGPLAGSTFVPHAGAGLLRAPLPPAAGGRDPVARGHRLDAGHPGGRAGGVPAADRRAPAGAQAGLAAARPGRAAGGHRLRPVLQRPPGRAGLGPRQRVAC